MAGKINMAKALCVLIAFSLMMMSCAPALTVSPSPTATTRPPTKTATPSPTPTLTPSPTVTATATPIPSQIAEALGYPSDLHYKIKDGKLTDLRGIVWAHQDENKEWVGEFVHHETMWGLPDVYTKDVYTESFDITTISPDRIPTVRHLVTTNSLAKGIALSDLILEKIGIKEVAVGLHHVYVAELGFVFSVRGRVHRVSFEAMGNINGEAINPVNFPFATGNCYQVLVLTKRKAMEKGEYYRLVQKAGGKGYVIPSYLVFGLQVFGDGPLVTSEDLLGQMDNNTSSVFGGDSVVITYLTDPVSSACTK